MRRFTPAELRKYLQQSDETPLLIDVREPWEYDICHLAGSCLLPMGQLLQNPGQLDKEREIVLICHHGIRSRQVALMLEQQGFARLINLEGGLERWAREVDSAMPCY